MGNGSIHCVTGNCFVDEMNRCNKSLPLTNTHSLSMSGLLTLTK